MKIIQLDVTEDIGVDIISLVDFPAIEIDFLKFNSVKPFTNKFNLSVTETDKRIIVGPALIPDKFIYRFDYFSEELYYIYFTKSTVEKISQNYLKNNNQYNVNINHDNAVNDICIIESWIVDNPEMDKSKALGFNVPAGTWMITMKIDNEDVWQNLIKNNEVKGFSIEGYFVEMLSKKESKKVK